MSDTAPTQQPDAPSMVDDEIEGHKTDLNGWITSVEEMTISDSRRGVIDRFVRDCRQLITDLDSSDEPSAHDLSDFTDRCSSLEVQFHAISSNQ